MGGRSCSRVHSSLWQVEHLLVHLLFNLSTPCLIRTIFQSAFHSAISCIFVGWLLEWFQFFHQGVFLFGWFFLQFSSCALSCSQVGAQCYQWWSSLKRETMQNTLSHPVAMFLPVFFKTQKNVQRTMQNTLLFAGPPPHHLHLGSSSHICCIFRWQQPTIYDTNQTTIYGQS